MKTILLKPFEKYSEQTLLIFGVILTLIGSYLAFLFKARFDGVLDLHFIESQSILNPYIDNIINVLVLFVFLFLAGKQINDKTRLVDVFAVSLVSRIPLYLLPLFNINFKISDMSTQMLENLKTKSGMNISNIDTILFAIFGLCAIIMLVWYIALLYNGFKVSTNAKGTKPIILFILAIVFAEVVSKILINQITI